MGKSILFALVAPLAALLSVVAFAALPALPPLPGLVPRAAPAARPIGTVLHGDWVISVTERDGRPVSRTEFHNDLTPEGQAALIDLLDGTHSLDYWGIHLESAPMCPGGGSFSGANCGPEGDGVTVENVSGRITLSGDLDWSAAGGVSSVDEVRITRVTTVLHTCSITNLWLEQVYSVRSPVLCDQRVRADARFDDSSAPLWIGVRFHSRPFTSADLLSPVVVSRGQRISVRVTFSFAEAGR